MKKIFLFISLIFFLVSCNLKTSDTEIKTIANISVDDFFNQPETYSDQQIIIRGLVTHVCRHGGQKLFIAGNEDGNVIRISTSEKVTEFPLDMEGNIAEFSGTVVLMDSKTLTHMVKEEKEHHEDEDDDSCAAEKQTSGATYYILASGFKIND